MKNTLCVFGLFGICLIGKCTVAQVNLPISSLCELQAKIAQGEHRIVRVEGVYSAGLESQQLVSKECSSKSTAVEFALKSHRLWDVLVKRSNPSNSNLLNTYPHETVIEHCLFQNILLFPI
jgi:hypothetical protein